MGFAAGLRFLFIMIIFAMMAEFTAFIFVDVMGAQLNTYLYPPEGAEFNAMGTLLLIAIINHELTLVFLIAGFVGMFMQAAKPEERTVSMQVRR